MRIPNVGDPGKGDKRDEFDAAGLNLVRMLAHSPATAGAYLEQCDESQVAELAAAKDREELCQAIIAIGDLKQEESEEPAPVPENDDTSG